MGDSLSYLDNLLISLMYAISTLLLVAREACRLHNLVYYISRLLKLSTMCESPLHGPRNYIDRVRGRSVYATSCFRAKPKILYQYRVGRKFQ